MRTKCLVFLSVCLAVALTTGSVSATINAQATGDWSDINTWDKLMVPDDTEEIKIGKTDDLVVTVSTNVGTYAGQKIDMARGCTLEVVAGGFIGNGREVHVGDAGMSSSGSDLGYLNQTGGTVDISGSGKLQIGYKAGGDGTYGISGGSLTGDTGRMYLGCSSADGSIGKLQIIGSAATISLGGEMYVANDSATASGNTGTGTVEFNLDAGGAVSRVQVLKSIIDSQNEAAAVASLIVTDASNAASAAAIVLIENTGDVAVTGVFDTLNGGSGAEGSQITLNGNLYALTYVYAAGADTLANDIALVQVPEPATLAILGLGGLLLRRRLA